MTPLHLAATHDNKECCRLLIYKKAELRAADDELSTPLHMAATEGNTEVVKMLFQQAEDRDGWVTIQNVSLTLLGHLIASALLRFVMNNLKILQLKFFTRSF